MKGLFYTLPKTLGQNFLHIVFRVSIAKVSRLTVPLQGQTLAFGVTSDDQTLAHALADGKPGKAGLIGLCSAGQTGKLVRSTANVTGSRAQVLSSYV